MEKFINFAKRDQFIKRALMITLSLIFLTFLYILINYTKLPPLIPLFNQLPWGAERLSSTSGIFLPLGLSLFIFSLNYVLAFFFYDDSPLLGRMLAITSFIASLLTLLFIFRTISLIV